MASMNFVAPSADDRRDHRNLAMALAMRLAAVQLPPAEVLGGLTAGQVGTLCAGLEWALGGEAAADDFLRLLAQGPRAALELADGHRLPESEVLAVRDGGAGAASLATVVQASTSPGHFVDLLSATEDAPYWDRRRAALLEGLTRRAPGGGSPHTPAGRGQPTPEEAHPPGRTSGDAGGLTVRRAVEWWLHRRLTGPGAAEAQRGLGAWDPAARRALARQAAVALWGDDRLDPADARRHYGAAAAALRSVLQGWARARGDGLPVTDAPWFEAANGRSLVFTGAAGDWDCDWAAAGDLSAATAAAEPAAAEMLDLCLYAGLSVAHVAVLTGTPDAEVDGVIRGLLDALRAPANR